MKSSKQSITTVHLLKCFQNSAGIVFKRISQFGQKIKHDNLLYNKSSNLVKYRETVGWLILNLYAKSWSPKPRRSFSSIMINCSNGSSLLSVISLGRLLVTKSIFFILFSTNQTLGVQYNILPSGHPSFKLALLASYLFYLLNYQNFSKSLHFLPLTGPTVPGAYFLNFFRFASPASQCFSHTYINWSFAKS